MVQTMEATHFSSPDFARRGHSLTYLLGGITFHIGEDVPIVAIKVEYGELSDFIDNSHFKERYRPMRMDRYVSRCVIVAHPSAAAIKETNSERVSKRASKLLHLSTRQHCMLFLMAFTEGLKLVAVQYEDILLRMNGHYRHGLGFVSGAL